MIYDWCWGCNIAYMSMDGRAGECDKRSIWQLILVTSVAYYEHCLVVTANTYSSWNPEGMG